MKRTVIITFLIMLISHIVSAQVPQGIRYQVVVRNSMGWELPFQPVNMRFSFHQGTPSGTLVWEETQMVTTDVRGLAALVIGTGTGTGNGTQPAFNQIDWSSGAMFLQVGIDVSGGNNFTNMGTAQLFSVPYALFANTAAAPGAIGLSQFSDVDITGTAPGKVLKWNGSKWSPAIDNNSDTVLFVLQAGHATYADTAAYSLNPVAIDTVLFAYYSDTAAFAALALNSLNASNASYSPSATYALTSPPQAWLRNGNAIGTSAWLLGTLDTSDIVIKTNSIETARLTSTGKLLTGSNTGTGDISMQGINGFLHTGTFGTGALPVSGAGTRMLWYPAQGSFRAGGVDGTQWDNANIGTYSFGAGYNVISGPYSFATGNSTVASGHYAVAMGYKSQATAIGVYPGGTSVGLGDSCIATSARSVAIGRHSISSNNAAITLGTNNLSSGSISLSIGYSLIANGANSTIMGSYASANNKTGSFVYSDASSTSLTLSTANNQFMVRAAGGSIFYSDSLATIGMSLSPGGGSWVTISDRNKKENFATVDHEVTLLKIRQLEISSWNYKSQSRSIRHIGPMAQDFYKQFHLGESDTTISLVDMDGVIMSGILGLNARLQSAGSLYKIDEYKVKAEALSDFEDLEKRLDAIEEKLKNNQK